MSEIKAKNLNPASYYYLLAAIFFTCCLPAIASEHGNHEHEIGPWQIIVESDLLNIIILAGAIIYLGNKFLPGIIAQKKEQISKELENAKTARIKAEEELKAVQEKCKNISSEIEQIKEDAKNTAMSIQKRIEEETDIELEKVRAKVKREIDSAQDKAIQNIKKEASTAALKLAEDALVKIAENPDIQQRLIDDFLDEIDRPSNN